MDFSGTQCGGFQFLLILNLWGISFHAVVVFGLGKNFLFKSVLGHCDRLMIICLERNWLGFGLPILFHMNHLYE